MTSTVDEEIIRKRLLLDGEGAGDDRKLTMILKSFLKVNSSIKTLQRHCPGKWTDRPLRLHFGLNEYQAVDASMDGPSIFPDC